MMHKEAEPGRRKPIAPLPKVKARWMNGKSLPLHGPRYRFDSGPRLFPSRVT